MRSRCSNLNLKTVRPAAKAWDKVIYKRTNLRWVAVFEAAKGILVLAAASAAFKFVHLMGAQEIAEKLVSHFHLNPANRYPRIFLEVASHLNNGHLLALGFGALVYASIRLIAAYGLWYGRQWAWVFGLVSAGLYLPVEIFELIKHVNGAELLVFSVNVLILALLWRGRATS
jgi:uncharacterized membrane protein (DUF2068 family)